jgi:hypothetical protein
MHFFFLDERRAALHTHSFFFIELLADCGEANLEEEVVVEEETHACFCGMSDECQLEQKAHEPVTGHLWDI